MHEWRQYSHANRHESKTFCVLLFYLFWLFVNKMCFAWNLTVATTLHSHIYLSGGAQTIYSEFQMKLKNKMNEKRMEKKFFELVTTFVARQSHQRATQSLSTCWWNHQKSHAQKIIVPPAKLTETWKLIHLISERVNRTNARSTENKEKAIQAIQLFWIGRERLRARIAFHFLIVFTYAFSLYRILPS